MIITGIGTSAISAFLENEPNIKKVIISRKSDSTFLCSVKFFDDTIVQMMFNDGSDIKKNSTEILRNLKDEYPEYFI